MRVQGDVLELFGSGDIYFLSRILRKVRTEDTLSEGKGDMGNI